MEELLRALDFLLLLEPLANLAVVIEPSAGTAAPAAKVSASTDPSGSPPTANPDIVPSPLIVTGIDYLLIIFIR